MAESRDQVLSNLPDVPSGSTVPTMTSLVWRDGRLTGERLTHLPDDLTAHVEDRLIWIDLVAPTPDQIRRLAQAGLDEHTLEDVSARGERVKTARLADYTFSTVYDVHRHATGPERLQFRRLSVYALADCLLTIRADDSFHMDEVTQRWADDENLVRCGVDGLLHGLLDVLVDRHFAILAALDDETESLVDLLFADSPDIRDLQRRTFTTRRELVLLRRVVPPMRDVIATLIRDGQARRDWPVALMSYYEDLNDHVLRATEWCDNLRDLLSNLFETNLALNDQRMNEAMKKVGGVAAIIAVPTLITGWYGQNVPYWGFSTTAGFISSGVLVVVGVVGLYLYFRRKDWL